MHVSAVSSKQTYSDLKILIEGKETENLSPQLKRGHTRTIKYKYNDHVSFYNLYVAVHDAEVIENPLLQNIAAICLDKGAFTF